VEGGGGVGWGGVGGGSVPTKCLVVENWCVYTLLCRTAKCSLFEVVDITKNSIAGIERYIKH